MGITAPQVHCKAADEVLTVAIDFAGRLDEDTDEVLTGTPTVTTEIVGSSAESDLSVDDIALNNEVVTINGAEVAANMAVLYMVADGTAGRQYRMTVTCTTDGGHTVQGRALLDVE